ncbi:MAG: anthranilate synthase component I [Verrucomicrobia bacterium]|nr:anthranilate synthase component I [Verrucomicrobiota bacterium]MCG2680840.1 anthranilate synthase component I [Kiritimatiellia bacterium]MBU4246850.1 anthranilate synthase component I [Verrucomicrobiota bacterium]MBU4290404.1 anthranilate synthase component I [Verrucomicrobiota bacterium]MBU4430255.1 anthranilate synthase component I [Verrucomicrobiota bacterium]
MNTSLSDYRRLAAAYDVVPVVRELMADLETPVSMLRRFADRANAFLLESIEGGETWGRYSFIGIDPVLLLDADHATTPGPQLLEGLRDIYRNIRAASIPGLPRFFGGAVGFIGYEAVGDMERLPIPKTGASRIRPISRFLKVDTLVVFDNLRHTIKIIACSRPAEAASAEHAYEHALARIREIEATLRLPAPPEEPAAYPPVEFQSNLTPDQYRQMVVRAKDYIVSGDVIQVVLSQRFSARTAVPPLQMYRALRLLNPSPYMYFLKIGGQTLVGSSPEIMVRLTGRRIELRPIAGTRPRGATEQEDRRLADNLLSDEKEKAEHIMLVDLGRNDIGRVAEIGSVQVRDTMTIERYSHVMHIVSHVEGLLRGDQDAVDVIRATFPAGTLTGAPKIRAMEIIHELEPEPRGAYGGALGYISYDGSMDFAITIRTLDIADGTVAVQAGAGIVYNSDPQKEYEETCHKARGMQKAVMLAADGLRLQANG